MKDRPPIVSIGYTENGHGNPMTYTAGKYGITEIKEVTENGEYCIIPWVEVWAGDKLIARFNQHKLDGVFYA